MSEIESNVRLRPICKEDATVLMELNNDKAISDFVVGNPKEVNLEQQMQWMANVVHETNTVRWMIDLCGKAVGTVILSSIDYSNATGNMNIKLLSLYQGRGIAKKALLLACDIAFDELDIFCLTANILSYNIKSYMLFKKVGFHEDGILRSRVVKNGERCDLITLSLLKAERIYKVNGDKRNR